MYFGLHFKTKIVLKTCIKCLREVTWTPIVYFFITRWVFGQIKSGFASTLRLGIFRSTEKFEIIQNFRGELYKHCTVYKPLIALNIHYTLYKHGRFDFKFYMKNMTWYCWLPKISYCHKWIRWHEILFGKQIHIMKIIGLYAYIKFLIAKNQQQTESRTRTTAKFEMVNWKIRLNNWKFWAEDVIRRRLFHVINISSFNIVDFGIHHFSHCVRGARALMCVPVFLLKLHN